MYHWYRCRLIIRDEDHSLSAHKWKAGAGEGGERDRREGCLPEAIEQKWPSREAGEREGS